MNYRNAFNTLNLGVLGLGIVLLPSGAVMAADGKGNGGVAVVCRDATGKITQAEILDLFEGRNQFGLLYPRSMTEPDILVDLAQLKMIGDTNFLDQFRNALSAVRAGLVFLPRGIGLTPTDDAFPTIAKKGCQFEQLANYQDEDSKIYVDEEIYQKLSAVDRAALYVHEAIYKMARNNLGDTSSVRSRKFTSQILASNGNSGVIDSLMNAIGRKSDPLPENLLLSGIYATESKLCGLRLYVNDDHLVREFVTNPKSRVPCQRAGEIIDMTLGWAKLRDGKRVKGFTLGCGGESNMWCELIEIIDNRTFAYSVGDIRVLFYLW